MSSSSKNILIIVGEQSADCYGFLLIKELKKILDNFKIWGTGGQKMQELDFKALYNTKELSLLGLFEVVFHLRRILKIKKHLLEEAEKRKPSVAVLVDFPEFNLSLAKSLKKMGIPVVYYISPTIWAWRYNRIKKIKKFVEKMLLIFPFEKKIYRKESISYRFVGHPLFEIVKQEISDEKTINKYNPEKKKHIVLMPGSRKSEIKYHTGPIVEAVRGLSEKYKNSIKFTLIKSSNIPDELYKDYRELNIDIISKNKYSVMKICDLIISTSGTSNFEAMILKKPVIVVYKISYLSYLLAKRMVKIKNISIVNILAGKEIIPELVQKNMKAKNIVDISAEFLEKPEKVEKLLVEYNNILKEYKGKKEASYNAAFEIVKLIKKYSRINDK